MAETPQLCYKIAADCVHRFTFENHTYVGCTTVKANHSHGHPWCSHVEHFVWDKSKWSYCLQVPCTDSSHAKLFTPEGMRNSVMLNVLVVMVGLTFFAVSHQIRKWQQHRILNRQLHPLLPNKISEDNGTLHSTAVNYLVFLKNGRDMFVTLTVVSLLVVVPVLGKDTFLFGCVPGPISLMEDATPKSLTIVCILALLHGCVVIYFIIRFHAHCKIGHQMYAENFDLINRTLWLTHLPSFDVQTREPWSLTNEDLKRVEEDLKEAMLSHLKKELPDGALSDPDGAIEAVHVTPVVTEWHSVVSRIKHQEVLGHSYARRLSRSKRKPCQGLWRIEQWWFERKKWMCFSNVEALREKNADIINGQKQLTGSAFVVFRDEELKNTLAGVTPGCFTCRNYTYWRFGRAPFQSVTLRCLRAPHPSDLIWDNLHVSEARRRFGYITGRLFLLVFMLLLVTPVAVTSQLNLILHFVQEHTQLLEDWLNREFSERFTGFGKLQLQSAHFWQMLSEQVPTIALVMINSLVLPPTIYFVAGWQRCRLRTTEEKTELHLNYFFLVINQIIIPLLGLSGIPALFMIVSEEVQSVKDLGTVGTEGSKGLDWAEAGLAALFSSPAAFSIKYLLNCAMMTNANSLMNLPQLCYRTVMGEPDPWCFSYGYWYAFSMGIIALGFGMGIYVPSLLPSAAFFFCMRYFVDQYNIRHHVYQPGVESLGSFSRAVRVMLETTVALWWLLIGAGALLYMYTYFADYWDGFLPRSLVLGLALWLVFGSFVLMIHVFYLSAHNARRPVHVPRGSELEAEEMKKKSSPLMEKGLSTIFGDLHDPKDEADEDPEANTEKKEKRLEPEDWDVRNCLNLGRPAE